MNEAKEIKKYCNEQMYSDVMPYEVVRIVSERTVEIRPMISTRDKSVKMEFVSGGFAGHCVNQRSQKWTYESNPEAGVTRITWSEANQEWKRGKYMRFYMADAPHHFYDYNF